MHTYLILNLDSSIYDYQETRELATEITEDTSNSAVKIVKIRIPFKQFHEFANGIYEEGKEQGWFDALADSADDFY